MNSLDKPIREGHFAKKQILSKDWLISWSHSSRFRIGLELARQFAGKRILDYGCGDGTFLAMLMADPSAPRAAVGVEVHPALIEDCRARLGGRAGLSFSLKDELDAPEHYGSYDAVICMEVLEHVLDVEPVLDNFARLLNRSGRLLISLPVETGFPLVIKQAARRIAGWRGIGDYPGTSPYTLREYCASIVAGRRQQIVRPILRNQDGSLFHDHKGFNWMAVRESLLRRFVLERTLGSPVTWLSPHLASQVWFLARKKN
jgi:SAM-dependent methyltransferase